MKFDLDEFLRAGLAEDVASGDLTTIALIDEKIRARGELRLREEGVVSGIRAGMRVFELLDDAVDVEVHADDGEHLGAGGLAAVVTGSARTVLTGERLALNLFARMSGIATLTNRFVKLIEGTGADVVDTRKTTPLLRQLEKDAVRHGGGVNHRFGLYDAVLVKDNHLDLIGASGSAEGMAAATVRSRESSPPGTFIQIEAQTLEEALAVAGAGADSILFDNFRPQELKEAVRQVRALKLDKELILEASGGINVDTVRGYAETGVDRISIGALTHSARSLDVTLEIGAA